MDTLIPWHSVTLEIDEFVAKKTEPAFDTLSNFGLFVGRKAIA